MMPDLTLAQAMDRLAARRMWAYSTDESRYFTRGLLLTTLDEADTLAAEIRRRDAMVCETCRYNYHGDCQLWCVADGADADCADIKGCGAWQKREGE